jgi:MFS family permease
VPVLAVSYVGALLWGLGIAIGFPLAMTAAGETPGRGPSAIATVATIAYTGFLVGPPLIGTFAHAVGLDHALWVVVALAAGMVALAGNARPVRDGGH